MHRAQKILVLLDITLVRRLAILASSEKRENIPKELVATKNVWIVRRVGTVQLLLIILGKTVSVIAFQLGSQLRSLPNLRVQLRIQLRIRLWRQPSSRHHLSSTRYHGTAL